MTEKALTQLKQRNNINYMAKNSNSANGHTRLDDAVAILIQTQAAFVGRLAAMDQDMARIKTDMATIIGVLSDHTRILDEHSRTLSSMPEAVRSKIGFQVPAKN